MIRKKINFVDIGQDLTDVEVECLPTGYATIVQVAIFCSSLVANIYLGKAILLSDNLVGDHFRYLDPASNQEEVTKFIIESIEEVTEYESELEA